MASIVFAHANGFPAGTYALLFELLRAQGHEVRAPAMLGHDANYPVTDSWPHLARQLADFVRAQAQGGQPPVLVGHSLGGLLCLMAAARDPALASAVLLLDSPIVAGWRARTVGLAKRTGLMARVSPSKISRHRREHWPSREAALAHFVSKRAFARWHPQMLRDYIDSGMCDRADGCTLAFAREVESSIYDTLPHRLGQLLKQQPLQCPLVFIGGLRSRETRQAGGVLVSGRYAQGRVTLLDGSHLFPMEHPHATAAAVQAHLLALGLARPVTASAAPGTPG